MCNCYVVLNNTGSVGIIGTIEKRKAVHKLVFQWQKIQLGDVGDVQIVRSWLLFILPKLQASSFYFHIKLKNITKPIQNIML